MNKLVWQQDFLNGNADLSEWNIRLGNDLVDDEGNFITTGWGNNEQQYYTGNANNLYIDNNGLHLCARLETTESGDRRFAYTSAKLDTKNHMSFCYGKLIVRAKLPTGAGIWPGIWMMPQDSVYGVWPASGEIDIMEAKGRLPDRVFGTLHHGTDMFENKITEEFDYHFEQGGSIHEFHDYGLEWSEDVMRWTVDGHCFAERSLQPGVTPFDQSFFLILNLAVGGWFDDVPIDENALPAVMTIAGIWLYQ